MSYILSYAPTNQSRCKGRKPCTGSPIAKGSLRCATIAEIGGNEGYSRTFWRHWGCVSPQQIFNMHGKLKTADEIEGFEHLAAEDQEKVRKAFRDGHVAQEDIPVTAKKRENVQEMLGGWPTFVPVAARKRENVQEMPGGWPTFVDRKEVAEVPKSEQEAKPKSRIIINIHSDSEDVDGKHSNSKKRKHGLEGASEGGVLILDDDEMKPKRQMKKCKTRNEDNQSTLPTILPAWAADATCQIQ
ncbi:zf-PARP-domain-containing protein [Meredithblackwellia eburnea MCA 4105]